MSLQCRRKLMTLLHSVICRYHINKCGCSTQYIDPLVANSTFISTEKSNTSIQATKKDVFDTFTENLVQGHIFKKESVIHQRVKQYSASKEHEPVNQSLDECAENEWSQHYVDKFMAQAVHSFQPKEITHFLSRCFEKRIVPSRGVLLAVAVRCSQKGEVECIKSIQNLCHPLDTEEYENQGHYVPYLAAAVWMRGNIEEAQNLYCTFYRENKNLRGKVKYIMKFLVAHSISTKGEAALVCILTFAKKIHEEFQDCTFLVYIWEHCILSDWFCDNKTAQELLETIPDLRDIVASKIPELATIALRQGRVDVTQRLFEVLLKYDKKEQYGLVLKSLFDYSCMQGDMRACLAIMESSKELEVPLTPLQHETFVLLFCNRDKDKSGRLSRKTRKLLEKSPGFHLKF